MYKRQKPSYKALKGRLDKSEKALAEMRQIQPRPIHHHSLSYYKGINTPGFCGKGVTNGQAITLFRCGF